MKAAQLLDIYIDNSGLKIGFIADQLGLSRAGFDKKRSGMIPFRKSEVYVLCDILNIKDESDKKKIFNT